MGAWIIPIDAATQGDVGLHGGIFADEGQVVWRALIEEVELGDELVWSRVLVVVVHGVACQRNIGRGRDNVDVRVLGLDGVVEGREAVCSVRAFAAAQVVFISDLDVPDPRDGGFAVTERNAQCAVRG